jgi:hypothetical protein
MSASKLYFATISQGRDDAGFWRVFYYAPGCGFETAQAVYTGRAQFSEREQAEDSKHRYEAARAAIAKAKGTK